MAEEDRRERKGEPPAVLGGCRPPPGAGAIRGDDVGIVPRRFVNVTPMSGADGGDLLLGAIVGAKHLEEEAAGVGGEICREDRTGDEARDGDQEDAGEPHGSQVGSPPHQRAASSAPRPVRSYAVALPTLPAGGSMTTKCLSNTP